MRTFELLVFATQFLQVSHIFHPQNHVGRGWGIRDGAMGAVRLPKILVLRIDDSVSAQLVLDFYLGFYLVHMRHRVPKAYGHESLGEGHVGSQLLIHLGVLTPVALML